MTYISVLSLDNFKDECADRVMVILNLFNSLQEKKDSITTQAEFAVKNENGDGVFTAWITSTDVDFFRNDVRLLRNAIFVSDEFSIDYDYDNESDWYESKVSFCVNCEAR